MTHKSIRLIAVFAIFSMLNTIPANAYWVWSPEQGKFINPQKAVDDSAEEQFNFSMQFYKDKNYKRAEDEFRRLVKQYPKSNTSAEALYYLGQVHELQGEYFKAFKDYQKIITDYPQAERLDEVVARQFRIGDMFMTGKKEKLLGLPIKPSLSSAVEIFQKIVETSPYSAYGDQAQFRLAQAYRLKRDWRKAGEEYQKVIDNYPDSNLADDARFQMAECIALQASKPDRDQRGLELAAQNFDQFLKEYPNSPIATKAKELKEAIDLKAAEKNYKIGQYYEKDNYMDSALIYYEDVVRSYPGTEWAKKAEDRILKLKQPEKFLKQRAGQIEAKQRDLENRAKGIAAKEAELRYQKDPALEKRVEEEKKKLKVLKKSLEVESSRFDKSKMESIKLRRKALDRDKAELKRKEKVLAEKRKLLKKNPSEDLERALERWTDSLEAERYSLYRQETDIIKLEEQFGIRTGPTALMGWVPFVNRREPLETTIRYKYKDFAELTERWEKIQKKKTKILREKEEFQARMVSQGPWNLESIKKSEELWNRIRTENPSLGKLEEALDQESTELIQLREKQNDLEKQIKKLKGSLIGKVGGVVTAPVALAVVPAGMMGGALGQVTQLNPFKSNSSRSESEQFIELLRDKENITKQIDQTKGIIQTIQTAFEEELASDLVDAAKEDKSKVIKIQNNQVIPVTQESGEVSPAPAKTSVALTPEQRKERIELKRGIKQVEREIRRRYEEIEDRKEDKSKKLDELAQLFKDRQNRGLLGPVGGTAKGAFSVVRMFFFGMKNEEWEMSKKARGIEGEKGEEGQRAQELRDSIELDNIMIEARGREIETLNQDLDVLKVKADSLDGFAFRSILIERPGDSISETVEEVSKIIPKKDKKSVLINRLDEETRRLADLEARMSQIDELIKVKTLEARETEKKAIEGEAQVPPSVPTVSKQEVKPVEPVVVKDDVEETKKEKIQKLTQQMNDLNLIIQNKDRRALELRTSLEKELIEWAQDHNVIVPEVGKKKKRKIVKSQKKITRELKDLNKDLEKLFKDEKKNLIKQQSLYQEKLEHLDKAISRMKKQADDRYDLLFAEKETVGRRLEQTSKILSSLDSEEALVGKSSR